MSSRPSATHRLIRRQTLRLVLLTALSMILLACDSVAYYGQAARGQLAILMARKDIETLLQRADLPASQRAGLQTVLAARNFAAQELHLPVGDSYSAFVALDRDHVVWNVFAAPEFSLQPLTWCYPLAGCVSYRGYFAEAAADRYAGQLAEQGYDVYTGGVDAYSTLGWFDDPVLSTVLERPPHRLAGLLFHELAHRLVYVPGDTSFNESFATFVEQEGVRRWLASRQDLAMLAEAEQDVRRQQQFVDLVMEYQTRFETLYGSGLDLEALRREKVRLQEQLGEAYADLKSSWGGFGGYDRWFAGPLNNAQLGSVSAYNHWVPSLQGLLDSVGGDLPRFYEEVARLARLDAEERRSALGN